jgi:hypothetical protein
MNGNNDNDDNFLVKLDRKTREQAKILYLADYDMPDICEKLSVDIKTLRYYVFGETQDGSNEKCWFSIKKNINSVVVSAYVRDKISVLDKTAGLALDILHSSLEKTKQNLAENPDVNLSIDDMKKLAGIVLDMDKMVRLESGRPTDIVDEIKHISLADARRILLEDPFAAEVEEITIEADYKNIERPSDNVIERDKDVDSIKRPWTV